MNRAFLVVGAEATGTRLATRILMQAGCFGSDEHFNQPFDSGIKDNVPLAVWRRSVPHSHEFPDIVQMVYDLEKKGYQVTMVITMREWLATSKATRRNHHGDTNGEALERLDRAYKWIFGALVQHPIPFEFVIYESLVLHPAETQRALLTRLNLNTDNLADIYDGNAKHYA